MIPPILGGKALKKYLLVVVIKPKGTVLIGKLRVGVEETMSLGELIQPIQRHSQQNITDSAVRFCLQKRQCVAREGCTHQILIAFSQQRSGTGGIGKQLPIVQQTCGIEIFLYLGLAHTNHLPCEMIIAYNSPSGNRQNCVVTIDKNPPAKDIHFR